MRAVDKRGSLGAAERVGNITGQEDITVSQAGVGSRYIDGFQVNQGCSSRGDDFSFSVEQIDAQSLGHTGTAIIGSAPANTDDESPAAFAKCVADQFSGAIGGGQ